MKKSRQDRLDEFVDEFWYQDADKKLSSELGYLEKQIQYLKRTRKKLRVDIKNFKAKEKESLAGAFEEHICVINIQKVHKRAVKEIQKLLDLGRDKNSKELVYWGMIDATSKTKDMEEIMSRLKKIQQFIEVSVEFLRAYSYLIDSKNLNNKKYKKIHDIYYWNYACYLYL